MVAFFRGRGFRFDVGSESRRGIGYYRKPRSHDESPLFGKVTFVRLSLQTVVFFAPETALVSSTAKTRPSTRVLSLFI